MTPPASVEDVNLRMRVRGSSLLNGNVGIDITDVDSVCMASPISLRCCRAIERTSSHSAHIGLPCGGRTIRGTEHAAHVVSSTMSSEFDDSKSPFSG